LPRFFAGLALVFLGVPSKPMLRTPPVVLFFSSISVPSSPCSRLVFFNVPFHLRHDFVRRLSVNHVSPSSKDRVSQMRGKSPILFSPSETFSFSLPIGGAERSVRHQLSSFPRTESSSLSFVELGSRVCGHLPSSFPSTCIREFGGYARPSPLTLCSDHGYSFPPGALTSYFSLKRP